jgi:uroporphyrin-III C-methyltransferase/precorrin-2 dehydrogenase/sirohydrochlorin ferrochelatase
MDAFPVFLDVRGRDAVVIGGGIAALRKAALLGRAGARVRVVAMELDPEFASLFADSCCVHHAEAFRAGHLVGATLAIAADSDPSVNERAACAARMMAVPVNVVDRPELSSFTVPAIVDRSPVMVAIATGGAAPVLARMLRARLEALLPAAYGKLAALAAAFRPLARRRLPDARARRRFWEAVFESGIADLVLAGRANDARHALQRMLDRAAAQDETRSPGAVHIVAAGLGDPDLLPLRALRLLQTADVIVHDRMVGDAVLDLARRDAVRIPIHGPRGARALAATSRLLAWFARAGRRVVYLYSGPCHPDRDDGVVAALAEAGITAGVLPSVTLTDAMAAAGIRVAGTFGTRSLARPPGPC